MNKKNLLKAVDWLLANEKDLKVDMGVYGFPTYKPSCETVGCVAFHLANSGLFDNNFLMFDLFVDINFSLSTGEALWVFGTAWGEPLIGWGNSCISDNTAAGAAARILYMLWHGVPSPDVFESQEHYDNMVLCVLEDYKDVKERGEDWV